MWYFTKFSSVIAGIRTSAVRVKKFLLFHVFGFQKFAWKRLSVWELASLPRTIDKISGCLVGVGSDVCICG